MASFASTPACTTSSGRASTVTLATTADKVAPKMRNINASSASGTTDANEPPRTRPEFPRGPTVPFPYDKPYPQQTALMDTMLHCLQQREAQDAQDATQTQTKRRRRATVMMLESPTGTGKSLSLACSAMAWLRYCEERDLWWQEHGTAITSDDHNEASSSSTSKSTQAKSNEDNWWNAWVPPETAHAKQDAERRQEQARQSRQDLHDELDLYRRKLQIHDTDTHNLQQRIQQRRDNMVRSAVTTAKMAERSALKRDLRLKKQRRNNSSNNNNKTNIPAEDFCLQDYTSDPETHPEDSDAEDNPVHGGRTDGKASHLLNGHALDGSLATTGQYRDSYTSYTSSSTSNNVFHNTVGRVQPGSGVRKIIYAARTHSQLSQFVGELRRTQWGETVRVVALGGRQLLCGNAALQKSTRSEAALTEACLDLKKGKKTTESSRKRSLDTTATPTTGCPLLESKEAVATLGLHLLTTPSDIEDAARLGTASHTCAYYASRKALAAAEIVVVPYSMLLSASTRQAVGLSLRESLVIVDEAHNLPEALRQLNSSQLSLPIVQAATAQLLRYTKTYAQRLAGRNLLYLGQLRKILQVFTKHLQKPQSLDLRNTHGDKRATKRLQSTGEFLMELKVDNINLFKLLRYLERSRLSQKLLGFTRAKDEEELQENCQPNGGIHPSVLSKHISAMSIVETFLEKLNLKEEGKIVTDSPDPLQSSNSLSSGVQQPTLRYVLLQPACCFDNVLEEAHALALVGGTLAPFGHVAVELLSVDNKSKNNNLDDSLLLLATQADESFLINEKGSASVRHSFKSLVSPQFAAFTCDHVVSPSNVMVQCLATGPSNRQSFDFRHQQRSSKTLCQELGQALLHLAKVIPNGLVVFLPSYAYEAHLVQHWEVSGIWNQLDRVKKIFREPKQAQQLDATLQQYAKQAVTGGTSGRGVNSKHVVTSTSGSENGALLLAVIGGKMSEGINLANEMARGVVVVGLPYPDITSPELKEKMASMDQRGQAIASSSPTGTGGLSGQAYYQNLCMRAVNQSVGRAIRHANDYAAILLCDYRYGSQANIWSKLPKWLRTAAAERSVDANGGNGVPRQGSFQQMTSELDAFFRGRAGVN